MQNDIEELSKGLTLWGSKEVVGKWSTFRREDYSSRKSVDMLLELESIMNAMRRDLGQKKAKKGKLLGFFVNDIDEHMQKK